jgi:Flagellar hook-length control protein FliK
VTGPLCLPQVPAASATETQAATPAPTPRSGTGPHPQNPEGAFASLLRADDGDVTDPVDSFPAAALAPGRFDSRATRARAPRDSRSDPERDRRVPTYVLAPPFTLPSPAALPPVVVSSPALARESTAGGAMPESPAPQTSAPPIAPAALTTPTALAVPPPVAPMSTPAWSPPAVPPSAGVRGSRVVSEQATAPTGAEWPSNPGAPRSRGVAQADGDRRSPSGPRSPTSSSPASSLASSRVVDGPLLQPPQGLIDDGRAKIVTAVASPPAVVDAGSPAAGERLRDALASVANHAILRGTATGHIDVPELGRVAVRARGTSGAVDVDVTTDGPDARAVLRGHVGEMTADLHQAALSVARLTVDRTGAGLAGPHGHSASSQRDHGAAHDSPRDQRAPLEQEDDPSTGDTRSSASSRVRIVL